MNATDAYEKIKLGACSVQLVSGLIFQGPGIVSDINNELNQLLLRDGFSNIKEAIGTGNSILEIK